MSFLNHCSLRRSGLLLAVGGGEDDPSSSSRLPLLANRKMFGRLSCRLVSPRSHAYPLSRRRTFRRMSLGNR